MSDYLKWIREGDINPSWIKNALDEVKQGQYSLQELRKALKDGLEAEINLYQSWIDDGDKRWKEQKAGNKKTLSELEKGETVLCHGVKIPAEQKARR